MRHRAARPRSKRLTGSRRLASRSARQRDVIDRRGMHADLAPRAAPAAQRPAPGPARSRRLRCPRRIPRTRPPPASQRHQLKLAVCTARRIAKARRSAVHTPTPREIAEGHAASPGTPGSAYRFWRRHRTPFPARSTRPRPPPIWRRLRLGQRDVVVARRLWRRRIAARRSTTSVIAAADDPELTRSSLAATSADFVRIIAECRPARPERLL